jgi:hypothetical protein
MSSGDVIFISGATGLFSSGINGPYDRTAELSGGYAVYAKRGDGSVCIEHRAGRWQVKHVSNMGQDSSSAFISGNRALEDCASCVWRVWDGKVWDDQPSVKMATGREAERQVSGGCMRAHAHACDAAAPDPRA